MIYRYSRYNLETGRFTGRSSNTNQSNIVARDGEGLIEGVYDHNTQMVVDGIVVDIPASAIEQEEIDRAWINLRQSRNQLLQSSDWTQGADAPLSEVTKEEYRQYRVALRQLPDNTTDPRNPTWPTKPT